MAIVKPIVLTDEGTATQSHDVLGAGDTLTPDSIPVSAASGNNLERRADGLFAVSGDSLPPISMPDDEEAELAVGSDGEPYWRRKTPCLVQTTTAAAPTLDDLGKLHVGGGTITLNNTLPVGWRMDVRGAAAVVAGTGASLQSMEGASNVILNGGATIIKTGTNTFWLAGAIE